MLVTTAGYKYSNSYITLEEAESILTNTGMKTEAWQLLSSGRTDRVTGAVAGPYILLPGVNDTLLLSLSEDSADDKTVIFPGSGDAFTDPITMTATQVCVEINKQISEITATPTSLGSIKLSIADPTGTLYIKTVDQAAYSTFGLIIDSYPDTVSSRKEYILEIAAQLIGLMPISGSRVYEKQGLDFPRDSQLDVTIIPDEVKEAQALLACLVVQPNLDLQPGFSNNLYIPSGAQNLAVTDVKVAGIMDVKATNSTAIDTTTITRSLLESLAGVFLLPVYTRMKPFLTQIRGGTLASPYYSASRASTSYFSLLNWSSGLLPEVEL
jgi:hypothetical protein